MKTKKALATIAFILGTIITLGAITSPIHADADAEKPAVWLQVSPVSRSLTLKPGEAYDGEFTVSNIGSEDFSVKVYASPFSVIGEQYDHDYSSSKNYNQIHRWITFDRPEYTLAVGESIEVTYHIQVPENVPAGSQHAVLFAESGGNNSDSGGIQAISRVGVRLSAHISGQTHEEVAITDYSLPTILIYFFGDSQEVDKEQTSAQKSTAATRIRNSQVSATSKVKNSGNVDVRARYRFNITPYFGGDSVYSKDEHALIYPDSEYRHSVAWDNTPRLGLFSVTYNVTAGSAKRDETRVVFVAPAWLLVIVLILLTIFTIWIILKVKKRRQLRSKLQL